MLNNENEIIHDLYALRAGLSVISKLKDDAAIWTAECGGGCFEWKNIMLRLVYDLNFFPAC